MGSKVSKCVPKSPGWIKNPGENTGLVYGVKPMVQTSFPPDSCQTQAQQPLSDFVWIQGCCLVGELGVMVYIHICKELYA